MANATTTELQTLEANEREKNERIRHLLREPGGPARRCMFCGQHVYLARTLRDEWIELNEELDRHREGCEVGS